MLENTNKKRTKALILFLASSGCRVGVIPELKLKHIIDIENCKQVLCYAESKEEYTAFMTPEASKAFDDYLEERQQDRERLKPESPAFRKTYVLGSFPADTMETGTVRNAITITLKDVSKTKTGTRFNIPILHGLRKYFDIAMKDRHDNNLSKSEKLMGHSVSIPLDNHYGTFSNDKLFEEYQKAIPYLTISNEQRDHFKIEALKKEVETIENLKTRLEIVEKQKEDMAITCQSEIGHKIKIKDLPTKLQELIKKLEKED